MTTPTERIEQSLVRLEADTSTLNDIVHGPENETVPTESGEVPTVAELFRQIGEQVSSVTTAAAASAEASRVSAENAAASANVAANQVNAAAESAEAAAISAAAAQEATVSSSAQVTEAAESANQARNSAQQAAQAANQAQAAANTASQKADAASDAAAAADAKAQRLLTAGDEAKGSGAVPFDAALSYPAGSVGAAVKSGGQPIQALRDDLANSTDPAKGTAIIGRSSQVVPTIAQLRGLRKDAPSKHAEVMGYYTPGDGGGGLYYLDADDTTSADNGGTTIVAVDGGRWKLNHRGIISIRQFGARGNGSANDSSAIQATIDYASASLYAVFAPAGNYFCGTATINIPASIQFFGESQRLTTFSFSASASAAITLSQGAGTYGAQLKDFTLDGAFGGKTGLKLGDGTIDKPTVDCRFQNIRISNMSIGIDAAYSWACQWDNLRVQGCTQPAAFGSQVNATLFNNVSFVGFTSPIQFINCEGLEFSSCNIANHTGASVAMTLLQSAVLFTNPYFENNAPVLARVGLSGQSFGSIFRVEGGILNSSTVVEYRGLADISITGLRVDKPGVSLKTTPVGSSGNAKLEGIVWRCKQTATDSITQTNKMYTRSYRNFAPFASAFGGGSLSYDLLPTHLAVTQSAANNGISLGSIVVGEQYTVAVYARRGTAPVLSMRGGNNAAPTSALNIPLSGSEFELIVVPFVATESNCRLLFTGSIDIKEVSLYSGVIGRDAMYGTVESESIREWRYSAAPTSGAWLQGDTVLSTSPAASGSIGWVCTASGSPGTWKAFGSISA